MSHFKSQNGDYKETEDSNSTGPGDKKGNTNVSISVGYEHENKLSYCI